MAFATLEEAWGLPAAANAGFQQLPAVSQQQPGFKQALNQALKRTPKQSPPASPAPRAGPGIPLFDGDAGAAEARQYLARAYARYGVQGVLQLLPRQAVASLRSSPRDRPSSFAAWLADLVSSPEKVLVVLLAVFAVFVLLDRSSSPPDVGLAHMHPFPMVPGLTLTASS